MIHQLEDILPEPVAVLLRLIRLVTAAVPSTVDRNHSMLLGQRLRDAVRKPVPIRSSAKAMDQDHRTSLALHHVMNFHPVRRGHVLMRRLLSSAKNARE